jgi:hypothetical protein
MSDTDKIRENRLRRAAQRQGLALTKSRRRDERAWDYGTYFLSDQSTTGMVTDQYCTLDDIEEHLNA